MAMNVRFKIKKQLRELAEVLMEEGGVSVMRLVDAFRSTADPDDMLALGQDALDELVARWAKDIIKDRRRNGNGQLSLPFGDIDETVTTVDGEGGHVTKFARHATRKDLESDLDLHDENERQARRAHERAILRNTVLIPIMEEHGFDTAGEAMDWLVANGQ
jgi:hypothetical protein